MLLHGELANMIPYPRSAPRLTQWLLAFLTLGVWGLLVKPYLPLPVAEAKTLSPQAPTTFDTLTVQRINVVDASGKTRFVIANSARFPDVEIRGKLYKRSIHDAAGLVFYDVNGQETGGLVLTKLRDEDVANMTFDYTYQLTDGVRIIKQESPDGAHWHAGFEVFDRRPYKPVDESSQGVQRLALLDEDHNAQLVISDVQGHPRIRIGVDATGTPAITMLNSDGKEIYRAGK
jgi:hypothetical protein